MTIFVECLECHAIVEAEIVGSFEYVAAAGNPGGRYALLRCRNCSTPILVRQDNVGNLAEGDIWDTPVRLFPSSGFRVNPQAPREIRTALLEAINCFSGRAYTASAVMCRKTLEGVCAVHGVNERSLMQSLRVMHDNGIIDERLFHWSDALRNAGNEAAHDINLVVTPEDAKDILEFTIGIVDYLFSIRDQFEKFTQRHQR